LNKLVNACFTNKIMLNLIDACLNEFNSMKRIER